MHEIGQKQKVAQKAVEKKEEACLFVHALFGTNLPRHRKTETFLFA
mgnify:CR=1 FL=1